MIHREFKVKYFQREDGVDWFDVKMVVSDGTVSDFTGELEERVYAVLNSSSKEEFGRFIEKCKEAYESPDLFK